MNEVNKTLYIPLYAKSFVSRRGLFLSDKKAEEIWSRAGFVLKGKSASKWLCLYLGIRSAVFDDWLNRRMKDDPDAVVLHLGCGLDSRILRTASTGQLWFDLDFAEVITEKKRYFTETDHYHLLEGDLRDPEWLDAIPPKSHAIVIMEGVSMYLSEQELCGLTERLCDRFDRLSLLMDCYSCRAASLSRRRNPINDVGVTRVYGMDDPQIPAKNGLVFQNELPMTPQRYIDELNGLEKAIFAKLYAGRFAQTLYRLFEYKKG